METSPASSKGVRSKRKGWLWAALGVTAVAVQRHREEADAQDAK
jgi:hypothetical protein